MKVEKSATLSQKRKASALKRAARKTKERRKVSPQQLLELLPKEVMEEIAEQTGVDKQVKHLFGPLIVMLFILAVLDEEDHSLESLADLYNSTRFSSFSGKGGHKTAKSSLSDRLSTIKCSYLEALYNKYIEGLKKKYDKTFGHKAGWLTRFDSTMLSLCASLTDVGMRVGAKPKHGKGKVQIKVTLGLEGLLPTHVNVSHEQAMLSEERALKAAIEASTAEDSGIVTFDMGLKSRATFKSFDEAGRLFVTRLKDPRHEVVRTHSNIKGRGHGDLRFLSDQIVYLYSSGNKDESLLKHEFRLITAVCEKGKNAGTVFYFLTNILDLGTFEIADIYQRRWDIEVFFRFLKQEVGLRNLLATNENGIKAVIYLRLIAGIMIWAYCHLNNSTDYKAMKREFHKEVDWQITVIIGQLIATTGITDRNLLIPDFQGLMTKKQT